MANRVMRGGIPLSAADQPKRFNFSSNFLGEADKATLDEQMSRIFQEGMKAPPGDSYGILEGILGEMAREVGVFPMNFQDVAWAGAKGTDGKPMIQHVNEAIERTARITGKDRQDVVRDSLINAKSPLYALAGTGVLASVLSAQEMGLLEAEQPGI